MKPLILTAPLLVALAACSDGGGGSSPAPVEDVAPSIAAIANQMVPANEVTDPIAVMVDDDVTPPGELTVEATSDNAALVTDDGLAFDGDGGDRTLTITPLAGQTGTATITVAVTDEAGQAAEATFQLTVTPQQVSLSGFVRDTFAAGENEQPRSINDKEFSDDATDFDDLVAP